MGVPKKEKNGSDDQPAASVDRGSPDSGSARAGPREGSPPVATEKAFVPLSRKHSDGASKVSSASPRASPPKQAPTAQRTPSPGSGTKGSPGKKQSTPDIVGNKGTGAKNTGSKRGAGAALDSKTSPPVPASEPQQVPKHSSPEARRSKKTLKMPDGTHVGPEDRNRYIRAMQKEYLQCNYTPFLAISAAGFTLVTTMYLFIYHPDLWLDVTKKIRLLIGIPDDSEEPQKIPDDTSTPTAEITTAKALNASDKTSSEVTASYVERPNTRVP